MASNKVEYMDSVFAISLENEKEMMNEKEKQEEVDDVDPWAIDMTDNDDYAKFSDMSGKEKVIHILKVVFKIIGVIVNLYLFICSLSLMSSAFQILGGRAGGQLFNNEYISNPITGLIIGILVTVLVQSSSTSTSIIITMTGAGILQVHEAIPIIMGTNIGTSVTNTIVALTQSMDREQFRKSFAGATVLDMFNFLTVLILLPIEILTGYLEIITGEIVSGVKTYTEGEGPPSFMDVITQPLTDHVIQVNKTIIALVAQDIPIEDDSSMVKIWCKQDNGFINKTYDGNSTECNVTGIACTLTEPVLVGVDKCDVHDFIFANTALPDAAIGSILLVLSLFALCTCLILMVKLLSSMLKGSVARLIKKIVNTNFPFPFGWISGYLAIIVGALLTFLVQSSSVFTSTMTPLVGLGVISLKRMYPLTLGSNIGTTATGILAALATDSQAGMVNALQLSLCHFFFNVTGIVIWYPIPFMRKVPIGAAMFLGNTTATYRWFAVLYLLCAFFIFPGILLGLSFLGIWVMGGVLIVIAVIIIAVIFLNLMQSKKPEWLPVKLRTWDFLPSPLRSLEPYDAVFSELLLCCKCCPKEQHEEEEDVDDTISNPPSYHSHIFSIENEENYEIPEIKTLPPDYEAAAIFTIGNDNQAFENDVTTTRL